MLLLSKAFDRHFALCTMLPAGVIWQSIMVLNQVLGILTSMCSEWAGL